MPAVIPFIPLILGGAGAAASVYSANRQANASTDAANTNANAATQASQTQAQANANALRFQQQVYNNRLAGLNPYMGVGNQSLAKLGGLYGFNVPTAAPMQPVAIDPAQPGPARPDISLSGGPEGHPAVPAGPSGSPSTDPLVTLQAPTGATRQVPQSQTKYYIDLGARQIGGA